MLVLSRKITEKVIITTKHGEQITVCVVGMQGGNCRLGFDADSSVSIHRQEVYNAINQQRKAA